MVTPGTDTTTAVIALLRVRDRVALVERDGAPMDPMLGVEIATANTELAILVLTTVGAALLGFFLMRNDPAVGRRQALLCTALVVIIGGGVTYVATHNVVAMATAAALESAYEVDLSSTNLAGIQMPTKGRPVAVAIRTNDGKLSGGRLVFADGRAALLDEDGNPYPSASGAGRPPPTRDRAGRERSRAAKGWGPTPPRGRCRAPGCCGGTTGGRGEPPRPSHDRR